MRRRFLGPVITRIDSFPNLSKTIILLSFDLLVLTIVVYAAFLIRFGGDEMPTAYQNFLLLAAPPITCGCLYAIGSYGNIVRFHAPSTESAYVVAIVISAFIWSFIILAFGAEGFPRSIVVLYGGLAIVVYVSLRRAIGSLIRLSKSGRRRGSENVAIVGVNDFGSALAQTLRANGVQRPILFIDTEAANIGRKVGGLPVIALSALHEYVENPGVGTVILALPQRSRRRDRALLDELAQLPVRVQTIAPPEDIMSGRVSISDIRAVNIEDVLGRDPVVPDTDLLHKAVLGKHVLITGAGGSIGSELVRQTLKLKPCSLVLFELSEVALYNIEQEARAILAAAETSVEIVPVLGNACDPDLVSRIMNSYRIDVVLHAAAYKHVPLGESNASSCVANNVFSTRVLADCAVRAGVGLFILISTDKAVRPTNIMGASKRFAELILQDWAARQSRTVFSMVRFGNVLGSSGSVIPLFRDQIARGGPVTVTDSKMMRYFMTIPEAVELVLQAAGMATGGDVFVLNMGESVKIDTLARTLIVLSNFTVRDAANPEGDIEIVYTGIRPGEKMFEELLIGDGNVVETAHSSIMRCLERVVPHEVLDRVLREVETATRTGDDALIRRCNSGL